METALADFHVAVHLVGLAFFVLLVPAFHVLPETFVGLDYFFFHKISVLLVKKSLQHSWAIMPWSVTYASREVRGL